MTTSLIDQHVATKIQNALHAESVEAEERKRRSHATAGTRFAESTKAYRAYLDDMNRRLEEQPCMFERLQLAAAKDRAEKMFEKTLKKHGVSSQSL